MSLPFFLVSSQFLKGISTSLLAESAQNSFAQVYMFYFKIKINRNVYFVSLCDLIDVLGVNTQKHEPVRDKQIPFY